jgi:hypothetical protein
VVYGSEPILNSSVKAEQKSLPTGIKSRPPEIYRCDEGRFSNTMIGERVFYEFKDSDLYSDVRSGAGDHDIFFP